jgi:hypothetical protein
VFVVLRGTSPRPQNVIDSVEPVTLWDLGTLAIKLGPSHVCVASCKVRLIELAQVEDVQSLVTRALSVFMVQKQFALT